MTPQNDAETEASSYQIMEKTLSNVVSAGQDSQESAVNGRSSSSKLLQAADKGTVSCPSKETKETSTSNSTKRDDNSQEDFEKSLVVRQSPNESSAKQDQTPDEARVIVKDHSTKVASREEEAASGKLTSSVGPGSTASRQTGSARIAGRSSSSRKGQAESNKTHSKNSGIVESKIGHSYADAELSLKKIGSQHTPTPQSTVAASPAVPIPVSSSAPGGSSRGKSGQALRRGKWTVEEEAYVARVIQDFNSGFLNAPAGTTLRSYLSEKLQCDPMRITKKFTGDSCIGKRVFHPAVRSASNSAAIDKAQAELDALEKRWRRRLEMQQRESAKKAAASAAAANAAAPGRRGMAQGVGSPNMNHTGATGAPGSPQAQQNPIAQTASWLDRANAILRGTRPDSFGAENVSSISQASTSQAGAEAKTEIENQMREVQRLIYEGPIIQQTTAGLPQLLDQANQDHQETATSSVPVQTVTCHIDQTSTSEHADKRMRTGPVSGAEDAEALVGFLRSVRASAASGHDLS